MGGRYYQLHRLRGATQNVMVSEGVSSSLVSVYKFVLKD